MDEFNTYTPTAPAPRPVSHAGPLAAGIGIFLLGVAVGGGAMWYRNRPIGAKPLPTASQSPKASVSVSPVATNLPTITFKQTRQGECKHPQQDVSNHWDVLVDGVATGTSVDGGSCEPQQPVLLRQGAGWAVIKVPFTGFGGYILYGEHINAQYVNFTTKTSTTLAVMTDIAFSPDDSTLAYLGATPRVGEQIRLLSIPQGATELMDVSALIANGGQVGAFIFSPDSMKLAFAVGYGPDPERGEIYVADMKTLKFTKVLDTPIPPQELFWKADGTVGW